MKSYIIAFLSFVLFSQACKKDGLTKETRKGANTFSCKVDGKVFKPCYEKVIFGPNAPSLEGWVTTEDGARSAVIRAENQCELPKTIIYLTISNLNGEGEYTFASPGNRATYNYNFRYSSVYTGVGKIIITKDDRSKRILSGAFEFSGEDRNSNPGKVVEVTSGRFDITYK